MIKRIKLGVLLVVVVAGCVPQKKVVISNRQNFSGIYPHLAYYNNEGECGTGAVVPWSDRLWVITYGPHLPRGSSDKLYEISEDLEQVVRKESIGGTPANRMIHRESGQLFIGPYAIDSARNVRTIPYSVMPGRHTGTARHLSDPMNKVYYGTMEEGFYEVDVHSLEVNTLYEDGNVNRKSNEMSQEAHLLPGSHGKGLYSGQGVLVYSNNGEATKEALRKFDVEAGVLAEWNGEDWKVIRRNQFVEVTGPGGIYGNANPDTDPIWATGWDHKSVLLGVRHPESGWSFYRLPKASHSYDGAHGWNTEWPRIRDVGTENDPDYLMTMHGMFWRFPSVFSRDNTAGIRPRSAYLKVIGDYARWQDQLVFGCDDSAQKEFLNRRGIKGGIEGPEQSNSNLWFTALDQPDKLGPTTAGGSVWLSEEVLINQPSEPFLFAGWENRSAWVINEGEKPASFKFEIDKQGNGDWSTLKTTTELQPKASAYIAFSSEEQGEWIRVVPMVTTKATVHFSYTDHHRYPNGSDKIFEGLASVGNDQVTTGGLLYSLGGDARSLGILASSSNTKNETSNEGYYELDADMRLVKRNDTARASFIKEHMAIPSNVVRIEESSVLVIDDDGRRWRFPLGAADYTRPTDDGRLRICREVATERDLMNLHGTFYELPAENADGFAKVRPVASHGLAIQDYASYRGLLVMTGIEKGSHDNKHIITSEDGHAQVWVGAIDDLWKLGKPVGHGGPWKDTPVTRDKPSDPYLIGFYNQRYLKISHGYSEPVKFKIQVEPTGHGPWVDYMEIEVKAGETFEHKFPDEFQARWIRFQTDKDCNATAWLTYK